MRVRFAALVICLVVLGVVGTTAWYARYHYDPTAGPIDSSENGLGYAQPLEVGQDFSIGITTLYNKGHKPVVVDRVQLLGVTGNLELLGVDTREFPQGDVGMFPGEYGFPPARYPAKPLAEQNVVPVPKTFNQTNGDPEEGLELVIGIRATGPGISAYRAVDVFYRVGRRHYHELFDANNVQLCAPLAAFVDPVTYSPRQDCPPKELKDKYENRVLDWPTPPADAAAHQ